MEDRNYYDGNFDDIIISIPSNTIEMTTEVFIYEDGKLQKAHCVYTLEDLKDAQHTFDLCCEGEYPSYSLTEFGKQYLEELERNGKI